MQFRLLPLLLLALAGCASNPPGGDLNAAQTSWQGATYDEVVSHWGTPVRSTTLSDNRQAYTWVSETVHNRPAFFPSIGLGGMSFGHGSAVGIGTGVTMASGGGGELLHCERTLVFQNGRVAEQTWQGPAEYCGSFHK